MRVVFPCKGVIVLAKEDMNKLESFYKSKLMTSQLYDYYKNSNMAVQVGNFNYFPKNYSFVLKDANLLSIKQLRDILNLNVANKPTHSEPTITEDEENDEISDDSILSHPFFKTLKPLD